MSYNNQFNNEFNDTQSTIDPKVINQVSQKVKFYNKIIAFLIIFIIIAGLISGIYLYNFITKDTSNKNTIDNFDENKNNISKLQNNTLNNQLNNLNNITQKNNESLDSRSNNYELELKNNNKNIKSDNKQIVNSLNKKSNIDVKNTSEININHNTSDTTTVNLFVSNSSETILSASKNTTNNTILDNLNIDLSTNSNEFINNSIHNLSSNESNLSLVQNSNDVGKVEKKEGLENELKQAEKFLMLGQYKEFENFISQLLFNKSLSEYEFSKLQLFLTKYYFFIKNNIALASNSISKVKMLNEDLAFDYALLYIYLFGKISKEQTIKALNFAINHINSLNDEQKIELSKAMLKAIILPEAKRFLSQLINQNNFKFEISYITNFLKKYENFSLYEWVTNTKENLSYSYDLTNIFNNSPVKIIKNEIYNFKNKLPVSAIFLNNNLFYLNFIDYLLELNCNLPYKIKQINLNKNINSKIIDIFETFKSSIITLINEDNEYYFQSFILSNKPLSNVLQKRFNFFPFVSYNEKFIAFFVYDKKNNIYSLEVRNLEDGKSIFKTTNVFFRKNLKGVCCFSNEVVSYSKIDIRNECNEFYYFKIINNESNKINLNKLPLILKLYVLNLNKLEERPILTIKINSEDNIFITYLNSIEKILLSFDGNLEANYTNLPINIGTWIFDKNFTKSLKISDNLLFHANVLNVEKHLIKIYGILKQNLKVIRYDISPVLISEVNEYYSKLLQFYPEDVYLNLSFLRKFDNNLSQNKNLNLILDYSQKEIISNKKSNQFLLIFTLFRLKLYNQALENINNFLNTKDFVLNDAEKLVINNIKSEIEKIIANEK